MKKEEEHYYSVVVPKVRKGLRDFVVEVKNDYPEFVKSRRSEYLDNEIRDMEEKNKTTLKLFKKNGFSFLGDVILNVSGFFEKKKRIKRFKFKLYNLKFGNKIASGISDEDIEMAKNVDCAKFLDIKKRVGGKSWALCVFHNDHNPSMCCFGEGKGFYCFSCGVGGDAITLVKKLYSLDFVSAVKFINNN